MIVRDLYLGILKGVADILGEVLTDTRTSWMVGAYLRLANFLLIVLLTGLVSWLAQRAYSKGSGFEPEARGIFARFAVGFWIWLSIYMIRPGYREELSWQVALVRELLSHASNSLFVWSGAALLCFDEKRRIHRALPPPTPEGYELAGFRSVLGKRWVRWAYVVVGLVVTLLALWLRERRAISIATEGANGLLSFVAFGVLALGLIRELNRNRPDSPSRWTAGILLVNAFIQLLSVCPAWAPLLYLVAFVSKVILLFGLGAFVTLSRDAVDAMARLERQALIAHDLRSPLAWLKSLRPLLPAHAVPDFDRRMKRIADVIEDLDGARPVAAHLLSRLVDEILAEKRAVHAARAVELRRSPGGDDLRVVVEPGNFKRAVSNLIDNAVQAVPDKGQVVLGIAAEGESVVLEIRDTGKGIPEEHLPRIGERGFTLGKQGGNGRGFHYARAAVEGWGGEVKIRGSGPAGTTVAVVLRRAVDPGAPAGAEPGAPAGGERVWVLDDDATIRDLWGVWHERLGLADLRTFASMDESEEARLDYGTFDMAFVDRVEGSSWQTEDVVRHLKDRGVPVVIVATGYLGLRCDPADAVVANKAPDELMAEARRIRATLDS